MDDKELLELAAKAAGYDKSFEYCEISGGVPSLYVRNPDLGIWSPLSDDGDALRLAAKLSINIEWGKPDADGGRIVFANPHPLPATATYIIEDGKQHRRAIVRAAAEIARQESSHDR